MNVLSIHLCRGHCLSVEYSRFSGRNVGLFFCNSDGQYLIWATIAVAAHQYHIIHSGIWEELILLTVGQPASYDAGIRGKPLGGFPPNPLSLVLT